jgi:predicted outer membrane repeat protein
MGGTINLKKFLVMAVLSVGIHCATALGGKIIYVDATRNGDGSSWQKAHKYLQDGLTNAKSYYESSEIRVAEGIYTPDCNSDDHDGSGDRRATFRLFNGVVIKGGYAGSLRPDPNIQDIELYETILSGDLNGDDGQDFTNNGENSYHVITANKVGSRSILYGFTITGGNANMSNNDHGGGMFNISSRPAVNNCTFRGNSAQYGGGMHNDKSTPRVLNCTFSENSAHYGGGIHNNDSVFMMIVTNTTFSENSAQYGGGILNDHSFITLINCTLSQNKAEKEGYGSGHGGGIYNADSSSLTLTDCTFIENAAVGRFGRGGGIYNISSDPILLTNCSFTGNSALHRGGGIHGLYGSLTLLNCTFSGNSALWGGGMWNSYNNLTLTNCTFTGNRAEDGGGTFNEADTVQTVTNCIFWDNSAEQISGNATVSHSNVEGGWPGENNIKVKPMFIDADGTDNIAGTQDDNLRLLVDSPCLNTGDNSNVPSTLTSDLDGNPRIVDYIVDMGAYEGPKQGFLLNTDSVTVPPAGTVTFTVALAMPPPGSVWVIVAHHSGDPDIKVESGSVLIFNPSNYMQPQTVTLSAAEDADNVEGTALIRISAAGFFSVGVTATEEENKPIFTVVYVDADATGANDGTSWPNAYNFLQDGLADANFTGVRKEIRVGSGIYTPDSNSSHPDGTGNRYATFKLANGMAVKAGYAGFGAPNPNVRDIELYETILSGDLAGNDRDVNEIRELLNDPCRAENSYHVVTGSGAYHHVVLDGFTIIAGNANDTAVDSPYRVGGGMYNFTGKPIVTNCTFSGNGAVEGGGMFNFGNSPMLADCIFSINRADANGGGMFNFESSPTVNNCTFSENSANRGGGMFNFGSSLILTNCIFRVNRADTNGGGILNKQRSHPTLISCIFSGNSATNGNAISCESDNQQYPSQVQANNCIFWSDGNEIWNNDNSVITITYSDVHGGWPGQGNIDADPCFANTNNGNYHLKSEVGRWDVSTQTWIKDAVTSPCIDAGNPDSDWTKELWPNGERINMGVYGGTLEASMSLSDAGNIADLNIDGQVDYRDMKLLTDKWPYEGLLIPEDLSRDGIVNFTDFAIFADILELLASNPNPNHFSMGVRLDADLSWTDGRGAISHDVYFGTSNPPPFIRNQTAAIFDPGTMAQATRHYWRIDEVNPSGTIRGTVWTFWTMMLPPP